MVTLFTEIIGFYFNVEPPNSPNRTAVTLCSGVPSSVVPSEGEQEGLPAVTLTLTSVTDLSEEFQARPVLLHVTEIEAGELVSPSDLTAASANLLRQFLPQDAELWCKPEFIVAHGPSADTIVEIAKQRESDLIVLGARPESGVLGASTHLPIATAHKAVSHATCPVLTVRHD
jgi:nucleotide-binding universal stress UspA family protein